ncbi:MAG: rimN [Acidimicrobiaceae bacterium]|nr:rimN [Acidimicrobiaceae bacterium]
MPAGEAGGTPAELAIERLERGEVVALATDTVYGLAARAADPSACRRIFALKERPEGVALPVLVAHLDQALALADETVRLRLAVLSARLWPGALTIVVPRRSGLGLELGGDPDTVGLRCPDDPVVRALATRVGPLATTSANRHGAPPCRSAEEVRAAFGAALFIVDGGRRDGQPSTVVSLLGDEPTLLRDGPVSLGQIREALGVLGLS